MMMLLLKHQGHGREWTVITGELWHTQPLTNKNESNASQRFLSFHSFLCTCRGRESCKGVSECKYTREPTCCLLHLAHTNFPLRHARLDHSQRIAVHTELVKCIIVHVQSVQNGDSARVVSQASAGHPVDRVTMT